MDWEWKASEVQIRLPLFSHSLSLLSYPDSSALSACSLCLSIPHFSVSIVSRYTAFLLLLLLFFRRQVPADRLHRFLSLLSPPLFLKQLLFVRSYHYWLIKKTSLLPLLWLLPPLLFLAVMASIQTLSSAPRNTHRLSTNMISGWVIEKVLTGPPLGCFCFPL